MPTVTMPLARAETWIFDLDNTLYCPTVRLFDQINDRMTAFIMRELTLDRRQADALRARYWRSHGITLGGLVADHGIDPGAFLNEVHRIDLSPLHPDAALGAAIRGLSGSRIVHTNGARAYAVRVLSALGLESAFARVFGIDDKGLVPKPQVGAFRYVVEAAGIDPRAAVMVEDDVRNLEVPKALGMTTVWLCHQPGVKAPDWVDHRVTGLTAFLRRVAEPA